MSNELNAIEAEITGVNTSQGALSVTLTGDPGALRRLLGSTQNLPLRVAVVPLEGTGAPIYRGLEKRGWFETIEAAELVGTETQYMAWLRGQPCVFTGAIKIDSQEAGGTLMYCNHPAHLSRKEASAMAMKNKWWVVPFYPDVHQLEGNKGMGAVIETYSGLANKPEIYDAWLKEKATAHRRKWVVEKFEQLFNCGSLLCSTAKHWQQTLPDDVWRTVNADVRT